MISRIITILFLVPVLAFSQNDQLWHKEFKKTESQYTYGKYFQAADNAKALLKKMESKDKLAEYTLPTKALYYKYQAATGIRLGNDTLLESVFEEWDLILAFPSDSLGLMGNISMATSAFAFQKYDKANDYLNKAEKFVHKNSDPLNYWAQYIRIARMELYIQTMSYNQAKQYIEQTIDYQRKLTKRKEKVFNPKKGVAEFVKIKKKDYKQRLSTLGGLMVMRADILLGQGDLQSADSLYRKNENDLFQLVSNKDLSYLKNKYGFTRVQVLKGNEDAGLDLKQIRKKYAGNVKYTIPNLKYFEIFENEIRADVELGSFNRYKKAVEQYQREAIKNYAKKSSHQFHAEYLSQLEDFYKAKYKTYGKHMVKQYEDIAEYYGSNDAAQIPFLYDLAKAHIKNYNYNAAQSIFKRIIKITEANNGQQGSLFYNANLELGSFYLNYTTNYDEADSIFNKYFDLFVTKELHPYHPSYGHFLSDFAQIDAKHDNFMAAIDKYSKLAEIQKVKYGDMSLEYAVVLQNMASAQLQIGQYAKAETNLLNALIAFKTAKKTKTEEYVYTLKSIGELYAINGDYASATKSIKEAFSVAERFESTNEMLPFTINESVAKLYWELGKYDQAEDILKRSISIKEEKLGARHILLIQPYALIGQLYLTQGKLIEAEQNIQKAVSISREIYGENALSYLQNKVLLGPVYYALGDADQAVEIYNSVITAYESKFSDSYLQIADLLIRKTSVELAQGKPIADLMANLNRAADIITTNISEQHPQIAEVTELKALIYVREKNYDQALIQLQSANLIYSSTYGDKHFKTADNQVNIAKLYYSKGNYENAHIFYDNALNIYRGVFGETHPKYVSTLGKKGRTYYAQKNFKDAADVLGKTTSMYLTYLKDIFPSLSESEKSNYWNSIRADFELFNSLALNYYKEDASILGEVYNNRLATKAILLNSSVNLKKRVLNHGSPELNAEYQKWLDEKGLLLKAMGMEQPMLDSLDINIKELESSINSRERALSESSEEFAQNFESKQVTWEDVKSNLAPEESALEIIRFNYFDTEFTDSVIYVGLFVTTETKGNPEIVVLPNGNDLENRYYSYYQNAIKEKSDDKKSYAQFWEYFDSKLRYTKTIYLSGDGVYNQINPETFITFDKTYLIDKYTFYFISNTKELVNKSKGATKTYTNQTAVLFGNPKFGNGNSSNSITPLDPLPGAELEVNLLDTILQENQWTANAFIGINASESELKKVDSPRILHIATHGFFMADEQNHGSDELDANGSSSTNPLLRAGLLFTGAAPLLATENVNKFNQEDGVLTAYEAMNLTLDNTEIVFLSACETGRGEVKSGEGVYGLQRSFIIAGAQNVVMTLFKVDDAITQKLVNLFYTEWIKTGNKRAAFNNAKKAILKEYKDPKYWGSFIMVGLD